MGKVLLKNGRLKIYDKTQTFDLAVNEIETVLECRMEDSIHHGEEPFFILILDQTFVGVGPFVAGSAAIDDIQSLHPGVKIKQAVVRKIPLKYRKPFLPGLRLFPTMDICGGPLEDLQKFELTMAKH